MKHVKIKPIYISPDCDFKGEFMVGEFAVKGNIVCYSKGGHRLACLLYTQQCVVLGSTCICCRQILDNLATACMWEGHAHNCK